jgi:hypothetical protein
MSPTAVPLVFRSKIDGWILATVCVSVLLSLAVAVAILLSVTPARLTIAMLLAGSAGIQIWLLCATRYIVNEKDLDIRSGPFRWRVPLSEISSVVATRNPLGSPALSLDRLRIGFRGRSVMISPVDREAFLRAVEELRQPLRG